MATGSLDANGIWLYGEDDSEPTASALLNKLGNSISDKFDGGLPVANGGTGATTVSGAQDSLRVGLVPIAVPTVVATGGTAAESGLNKISFTTCTDIRLQSIFTSNYTNYKIIFTITSASGTGDITARFMSGSTPNASGNYQRTGFFADTTIGNSNALNATEALITNSNATNGRIAGIVEVISPQASANSFLISQARGLNAANQIVFRGSSTEYNTATQFDGFLLRVSTGNITGTIQVFGYND